MDGGPLPSVTVVFLVYNRRDELRTSLRAMLDQYEPLDVIVVDNASTDGSAEMVRDEFPQVRLIVRETNCGVSGWNDGLAAARGDYVLALDDDCYLPPDGLRRSVLAARRHGADLVSYRVVSTVAPGFAFSDDYRTGLLTFWGCAVLMRREVIAALGGYDPAIFVWANELELMLRFYDRGFRHLHLPEVAAQHMKAPQNWNEELPPRAYSLHSRHLAYVAGKLLRPRDATGALVALVARAGRDAVRIDRVTLRAIPQILAGFVHGLRRRAALQRPELSRFYRRNFESFASPWWLSRRPTDVLMRRDGAGRREQYFRERSRFYPDRAETLEF